MIASSELPAAGMVEKTTFFFVGLLIPFANDFAPECFLDVIGCDPQGYFLFFIITRNRFVITARKHYATGGNRQREQGMVDFL
ncbi:Uncharacterised protein [Serratia fonticola]|uniref:Uncharacterized protein n=1 Tax=Serratia fonticola TaxID=47917 RepID=A0A4U9WN00_SERFO|nr:Uncharacterised protein [Serratia fonticola]